MISLNPYLVYNGNCEEAFYFYKKVFHTADLYIARYQDAPVEARTFFSKAQNESVMHATLKINDHTVIMGNDSADPSTQLTKPLPRDFYIYLDADNPKEAIRIFNELSVEGQIIMSITTTFWSPLYGILIDKFGIQWKITAH